MIPPTVENLGLEFMNKDFDRLVPVWKKVDSLPGEWVTEYLKEAKHDIVSDAQRAALDGIEPPASKVVRLQVLQGVPIKPENWQDMVRAQLMGNRSPGAVYSEEKPDTQAWVDGGNFTKPGIGDRPTDWPSFSANSPFGAANPTCATCGGRLRGAKKCTCEQPHDHWKPLGPPKNLEKSAVPQAGNLGGFADGNKPSFERVKKHLWKMQQWHENWLREAYRVLKPGGVIKAFSGSRTFHRLAAAMETVGFVLTEPEEWIYGSGFPKSLDISKTLAKMGNAEAAEKWKGWGTALKPAQEPILVGIKPALVTNDPFDSHS